MRVAALFLAVLFAGVAHAADEAAAPKKPTDTAPLKAHLKELGVDAISEQLLGVGLLTVNDVRLLTAEDMKELKFSTEHKTAINTWIDSKTGKTEIQIPVFSKDIEAKLQEEGIKSAADIRTLSEDDMMDMGMNIGQRNRVFNWIEHTANMDKSGGAKKEGEEDDEFYDDEEEEEEEAEELAPEDPNKPRVRGFGMKMKRSAKEGNGEKYRKAKADAKAKREGSGEYKAPEPKIPDNAPKYKVDFKGKCVIAAFFVLFFGGLMHNSNSHKNEMKAKYSKHEGKCEPHEIVGHHLQHSAKLSKRKKPTSKKAGKSKGRW